jgi:hypothetical protein
METVMQTVKVVQTRVLAVLGPSRGASTALYLDGSFLIGKEAGARGQIRSMAVTS